MAAGGKRKTSPACRPPLRLEEDAGRRRSELAALLGLWPHELSDRSVAARLALLARVRRALRAERRRGVAGHWAYDLARHANLLKIYREEADEVARLQRGSPTAAEIAPCSRRDIRSI
jgi:hypothetical protein